MFKRIFFCLCVIISSLHNTVCSTGPLKNKLLKATLHGAKNGIQCGLLFTVPAVIASKDAPKQRLLLLILSSFVSATGGAIFGGISALFPNKNPKNANNYWRAGFAGALLEQSLA